MSLAGRGEAIDWVLPDAYIAQQQGVCRERIRQIRLELGAPVSPLKNQRKSTVDLYIWISKNRFRAVGLTAGEVVDASGLAVNSRQIAAAMAAAGIPWETQSEKKIGSARALAGEFNWDLPNRDLSRTWGMHHVAVAKYRSRLAAGPARWDGRRLSNGRRRGLPIDYLEALVAERLNASGRLRGVG